MNNLPVAGAAMRSSRLPDYVDWLCESQRDLEIQDAVWYDLLDSDWLPVARNIRSMLDGYSGRLGIHGPFISLTAGAFDPKIRQVVSTRYMQALEFAAEVGATHMVVHSPHNFLGTPFQPLVPSGQDEPLNYLQAILDTLADVAAYAEKIGCTLVIENIFDRDPALWMQTIRAFNSDFVRASVDVGHAFITHRLGAPPPDYWIREAGPMLAHVHLQDSDGHADRHWVPGTGSIVWQAIFDGIAAAGSQPRLIIEIADQSKIQQAAQWLADRGLAR